jgi:branched-chain amino acid transport system permease protein
VRLFLQQVINGAGAGSQYALWAVGYGLVYQVLGLMHFAHGDVLCFALFVMFTLAVTQSIPMALAISLVLAVGAILSVSIWYAAYKPLVVRGQSSGAFTAALGAALILRNVIERAWGPGTKAFPDVIPAKVVDLGGAKVSLVPLLSLVLALAVVAAFDRYLSRTRRGQGIVALAQDRGAAALMGINVGLTTAGVYALSGVIGMVGAVLFVANFHAVTISVGFTITLKAFIAAILGGFTSLKGAVVGGLLLGVGESLLAAYVTTTYRDALVFGILVVLLVVRPNGLFGRPVAVKV